MKLNLQKKIIPPVLMAASVLAAGFVVAQQTNDASTTNFQSFQIIAQRNIFDPNRYPRMSTRPRQTREVVPTFSLAGTMSYRKGMFAFFDGTSSDYQKALQEGGTIAGYTVAKITLAGVQLEAAGKRIELAVGAAMRQEGNSWQLSAPGEWSGSSAAMEGDDNSSSEEATPAANTSSINQPNDILKRLMQKREQELK